MKSGRRRGFQCAQAPDSPPSVGDHPVIVYTRPGCPYCIRAKALLTARGVPFDVVDIGVEPERRAEAAEVTGARTLPQILVGRRLIGGFDDLKSLDDKGELHAAVTAKAEDGPPIVATPASKLAAKPSLLPKEVLERLTPRAEAMRGLKYPPGSRPTLRDFFLYAVTGKPRQDQSKNVPLNLAAAPGTDAPPPALSSASAGELAALLRQVMLQLLESFAVSSTGDVDYLGMRDSEEWTLFRALAAELGDERLRADLAAMDADERKAFFINLYNAMTFHGVVTLGRRAGWWFLYCFYLTPAVSYRLAGTQVSLDDVEHGLLRSRPEYFQAKGQELQQQMRMQQCDPRIHMALNCGAKGCPPVALYKAETLDADLNESVAAFVAEDSNVAAMRTQGGEIKLEFTELFKMYLEDFAGPGGSPSSSETCRKVVEWLLPHARGEKHKLLTAVLAPESPPVQIKWMPYNWQTNGSEVPLEWRVYTPVP